MGERGARDDGEGGGHMTFVQVSVRQTEYTSKGRSYRYKIRLHLVNVLQQQNSNISSSISPPYEHVVYAHTITTMQLPIRAGNINIC